MDEFSLISTYFKPLARGFPGSLNLGDDAAIISVPAGSELVVTKDAVSVGVHFIGNEDARLIAKKSLRVNLSDLAAMGATPLCYFLAMMLPKGTTEDWLKRFAEGLAEDQNEFHIHLAGGDTISTQGTLSFSVTAIGTVPAGKALRRSGAKMGDTIYVSGTLGDSALGLQLLRHPGVGRDPYLINRYYLPQPRISLGQKLISIAHACMDISDGLVQDLGHICKISGVGATINRDKLPLSKSVRKCIEGDEEFWDCALSGGDDYELLFTAPPEKEPTIKALAEDLKLPLTAIGKITGDDGITLLDETGKPLVITGRGFKHFS